MYEEALAFATERHEGQTRWDGGPYIVHPVRVADKFDDDVRKTVAVLHDLVEDDRATFLEILKLFGGRVGSAVNALTRRDDETYREYITRRVALNPIARDVKIADLEDNMADEPEDAEQAERFKALRDRRYLPALRLLRR